MGTVPMGIGDGAMMALRMAGISPPVERSMTVSAPYLMEYWSFSSSPSTLESTAELPMFELILQLEATPMHMGSRLVWLTDGRNIAAGGKIHDRIGAVPNGVLELLELAIDVGEHRGVADVRIDLAIGGDPDAHGLEVGVVDVGWDDHTAAGSLRADEFRRDLLALRDEVHFLGDDALAGVMHLSANLVVFTFSYPLSAHDGSCSRGRNFMKGPAHAGLKKAGYPARITSCSSWAS